MHQRKQMVLSIRAGAMNISQAARQYGVSRNTVKLWLKRAEESLNFKERSRRPHRVSRETSLVVQEQILVLKAKRPSWGAKKIVAKLWPEGAPLCLRTADRILARHGLASPPPCPRPADSRFERSASNELWQMDFKGMKVSHIYSPLSVLDDATRFVLAFEPLPGHRSESIFEALWNLFGEYGMPCQILSDNEACFASTDSVGPSWLEARLWLLGIEMIHGRPAHPQTQGKVERFHRTVKEELGPLLWQPTLQEAQEVFQRFLHDYNYERPHEAVNMKTPGEIYRPSQRLRPERMPEHEMSQSAVKRKVDASGKFTHQGRRYRAGHGLRGEYVELKEENSGWGVCYASRRFASLEDIRVP